MEKAIQQFMSVTGSSEDIARKYLEACAGDIDMAIGMHLESEASSSNSVDLTNYSDEVTSKNYEKMLVFYSIG